MNRQQSAKRSIRKRSFLLLELLISFALIMLCLFPLIKPHACMRQKDRLYLEQMQFERIAQEAFCQLKKKLYANKKHTWDDLRNGVSGDLSKKFTIQSGKSSTKAYCCHYEIRELDHCNKYAPKRTGIVIEIDLNFSPGKHEFKRTLYLERCQI